MIINTCISLLDRYCCFMVLYRLTNNKQFMNVWIREHSSITLKLNMSENNKESNLLHFSVGYETMTSSEGYTTKKSIQQESEKVSNFDDCEKSVRGGVIMIQSVVNNAIKQDDRFISFERNILFQDCNNSYGKYSCISLLFK
jgi:hydrogenase maturation factor